MIKVAPSILSADFAYLADEIKKIEGVLSVGINNIFYWVPPAATLKQ